MALIDYSELKAKLDELTADVASLSSDLMDVAARVVNIESTLVSFEARLVELEEGAPMPPPMGTYYVAPNGDDDGDGSPDDPWLTWNWARQVLEPGDVLVLLPGDHGDFLDNTGSEHKMVFAGTPENPITIWGDGATIPYVTLEGEYGILDGISGSYLFNRCNHLSLENCTFHTDSSRFNVITLFHDHHHIIIDNCDISGSERSCIDTLGVSDVIIRNCHIHDCNRAIQIKKGALNIQVIGCDIHDFTEGAIMGLGTTCTGDCQVTGASWVRDPEMPISDRYQAKNVTISGNTIHDGYSWVTVRLGGWRDYTIINNVFEDLDRADKLAYVIRIDSQHWEFKDAMALAHEPHRDCDAPCSSSECNRIILPSGPGGVIQNNIFRNFGGETLLRVLSPCYIPNMDYNEVEDGAYSAHGPSDAYMLHGVDYAPGEVPGIEGHTTYG
jgi:pectate lyase